MARPTRIQRRRSKGWRMPDDAIYVGRPTRWGNPWEVGTGDIKVLGYMAGPGAGEYDPKDVRFYDLSLPDWAGLTAEMAVALYRDDLLDSLDDTDPYHDELREAVAELAGQDLACWCQLDAPCHADVLLEAANR
jgi:hypothetical protein